MNLKKQRLLVFVIIGLVIASLVLAYVPLIFIRQPAPQPIPSTQEASLIAPEPKTPVVVEAESQEGDEDIVPILVATSVPPSFPLSETISPPDSFSGLEEESKSLEEIDSLLEGFE